MVASVICFHVTTDAGYRVNFSMAVWQYFIAYNLPFSGTTNAWKKDSKLGHKLTMLPTL